MLTTGILILASILIGVVGGVIVPFYLTKKFLRRNWQYSRKTQIGIWVMSTILTIILYPIISVIVFFPGSCIIMYNVGRRYL
jgi:hypothetical protein